jgi:hypothetical protein
MHKVLSAMRLRGPDTDAIIGDKPSWHLYLFVALLAAALLAAFALPFFG